MSTSLDTLPQGAIASRPKKGMKLAALDLRSFGFVSDIAGADGRAGYNDTRDVLLTQTIDGFDLNDLYSEFQDVVNEMNRSRQVIVDFLTFSVTNPSEQVQQLSSFDFERSTEYGEPRGQRQSPGKFTLGYDFDFYDLGLRFTWRFLAESTAAQIQAFNNGILDADNRLVFTKVLEALYTNTNRLADINGRDVNVYSLYNADGTVPPAVKSNTFDGQHTHYMVSGGATVTPEDLDDIYENVAEHGYTAASGTVHVLLVHSREGKVISTFRMSNGATYDFIPAQGQPIDRILELGQSLAGAQPAATYAGLDVIGKYGNLLIVQDDLFPAGYIADVATGGRANLNNPVGIREHENASLRGLKLIKGRDNSYPLIDSFYNRGIGTGIRQRGGAAIMQIKASGAYVPPAAYVAYQ